jgi:hypothetical protein
MVVIFPELDHCIDPWLPVRPKARQPLKTARFRLDWPPALAEAILGNLDGQR